MTIVTKILLVGCGKMGSAMLAGWLEQGIAARDVVVVDPHARALPDGVTVLGDSDLIPKTYLPDNTNQAVTPQDKPEHLPA